MKIIKNIKTKTNNKIDKSKAQLSAFQEKYQKEIPIIFFLLGVLVDIITISRIDDPLTISMQAVYLLLLSILLFYGLLASEGHIDLRKNFIFKYSVEIIHFCFGSLLSAYTVFYFKSASIFSSAVFMALLLFLLVINESKRFQSKSYLIKMTIFVLSLLTFFIYFIPIVLGFVGYTTMVLSFFVTGLIMWVISGRLMKRGLREDLVHQNITLPSIGVFIVFILVYVFQFIPPVPISIKSIGIYRSMEKDEMGQYKAGHRRPYWKLWETGDQTFEANDGDSIYCFVQIYSPRNFKDKIQFHWQRKNRIDNWDTMNRIPIQISGGRQAGYRGYSIKKNYDAGEWRVIVETERGREIGRIYFTVHKTVGYSGELHYDYFK